VDEEIYHVFRRWEDPGGDDVREGSKESLNKHKGARERQLSRLFQIGETTSEVQQSKLGSFDRVSVGGPGMGRTINNNYYYYLGKRMMRKGMWTGNRTWESSGMLWLSTLVEFERQTGLHCW
jgi:hypothetical protein